MRDSKDKIHAILVEYGVPLVKCDDCIIDGDLPSHGPYKPVAPATQTAAIGEHATSVEDLKKWLKRGRDPNDELGNAVIANDIERVTLSRRSRRRCRARATATATPRSATRCASATRRSRRCLIEHKADPNATDLSGWTPLMYAAWTDDAELATLLLAHGAKHDLTKEAQGLTPLAIAIAERQERKPARC